MPLGHVELTPLIEVNDIASEIFSLSDAVNVTAYVLANGLSGSTFLVF